MAISPKCIERLNAAAKRPLTDAQLAEIERRLRKTASVLARQDRDAWRALSPDQRTLMAAEQAMKDIQAEAQRKVENAKLQLAKTAATEERIARQQRLHKDGFDLRVPFTDIVLHKFDDEGRTQAYIRDLEETERTAEAIKHEYTSAMLDTLNAAKSGQGASMGRRASMFLWDVDNPAMTRDMAHEIFANADGSSGNALAKQGARAWLDTIEQMRQRFNSAGGDVGQLDYGYVPQPHDAIKTLKVGADKWASDVLPLLDRGRYLNEDGSRMTDSQVIDFLRQAWKTISEEGANKREPGRFTGTGARANRGGDARELHFADGNAYLAYLSEYGNGSMYDAMMGHVAQRSRDIALVERMGPNPTAQHRLQLDLAKRADGPTGSDRRFGFTADTYWNIVSGNASAVVGRGMLAQIGQDVRNIQTAGKLAGALLSSLPDLGTFMTTVGFHKLPYFEAVRNIKRANTKDAAEFLAMHGMMADHLTAALNRWTGENIRGGLTGHLANSTMKLSFLNAWTDGLRRAFSLTMMHGMARLQSTPWAKLTEYDRWRMENAGITETDWAIINAAKLDDLDGTPMLTPEAVREVPDDALDAIHGEQIKKINDDVAADVAKLIERNKQESAWISKRQDSFKDAQDKAAKAVKELLARKQAQAEKATGPILERMSLLEAQRERAELELQIERDLNKFTTQDEVRGFLNAVEDGASADLTSVGPANRAVRSGLSASESAGRRYGEAKGRLERRMRELENKITEMDREALSVANEAGKKAAKRIDELRAELSDFIGRAQERQQRRQFVASRLVSNIPRQIETMRTQARQDAATKLLRLYLDESHYAIVNPDLATRAWATGGESRGSARGELWRSVMQFKSFPIAMISRHWRRIASTPRGLDGAPIMADRLAYSSALAVSLTLLGAISFQSKEVVKGKDPVDMTKGKFWARAAAQGGAAGFFGDMMLSDTTNSLSPTDPLFRLLGPTAGSAADLFELTKGNIDEAAAGRPTHAAAEGMRFLQSHLPYVNLWYARTALERAFIDDAREAVSPGYQARMKQRARKDWGQEMWWPPGQPAPSRAPDFEAAAGR